LEPTLNIFRGALVPFSVSAIVIAFVASRLTSLDERLITSGSPDHARLERFAFLIKLAHALPLLIAPAVSAGLLVYFLQDVARVPLSILQTPWTLALLGFIQHVFIAYLLLEHVFRLSTRRLRVRLHLGNLPPEWRMRRAALSFQALAPPLIFIFGLMILLQHAMLAAPTFLTTKNSLIDARTFFERQGPPLIIRLLSALIIAAAVAAVLALMYLVGVALGRLALTITAHPWFAGPTSLTSRFASQPQPNLVTIILSATIQMAVSAAVLYMLGDRLWRDRDQIVFADALHFLRQTLVSPGVRAAFIAVGIVWLLSVWYRSARPVVKHPERLMVISAIIAFTPSSVLASMSLPMLTAKSQGPLLWCLLVSWAAAIAGFMFFHVAAEQPHPELINLRLLRSPYTRFCAGVLLGSFGSLAPSALVVLYILWIEDGLQATIRPQDVTVTSLLYRSTDGRWSATSLLGIVLGFIFWAAALIVTRWLTNRRHRVATWLIDGEVALPRRIGLAVVSLSLVVALPCLGATTSSASIPLRYTARGHVISDTLPSSETLRISEMVVDNDSTVELTVPASVRIITIEKLRYTSAKLPVIRFAGVKDQFLEQLSIRAIQYDSTSREEAVLQLSGLFIDELQITGTVCNGSAGPSTTEPRISVEMSEGASVRRANLTCLRASSIDVAVTPNPREPDLPASVAIVQVSLVSARIHGVAAPAEAQRKPGGTIEVNATMIAAPARGAPQLTIESFEWRGGIITLEPAPEEQFVVVNLSRVDRAGSTNTHLRLSKFPRSELRWEYGQLDGDTTIEAHAFQNLVLDHLSPGAGMNVSRLKVSADSYGGVALANVEVDQLEILAAPKVQSEWTIKTVQGVSVDEKIAIPRDFLESLLKQKLSPLQTRHFVTTLRDYGQYSDDNYALVGLDAVYRRKIIDLNDISPLAASVLDAFTGLGIRLGKPVITWLLYTLVYLVGSMVLIRRHAVKLPAGRLKAWGASLWRVVVAMLAHGNFAFVPNRKVRTGLIISRNVYRFLFVLQLTVLSIYLGQTALD
jgi:hypothetical protein